MPALTSLPDDSDELASTGLRQIAARGAPGHGDDGPETELPVPAGELLGGRYVVERIFAEGGMGVVCLGRHQQLEQTVAIKFLRRALANKPDVVERFLNEGRALAALRSEHVVRVMDVGQLPSGRPYLVMEHLDGIDLDALVDRDGPLSPELAVDFVLQVCEPLTEAHALGIVHRDIKPENLFLWSGGPSRPIVKVLDFGLAKQFGTSRGKAVTGPQDSMGSPCYMSPEQITTPQGIDARTDIWSLGVVLHRLLSDTLPFDGVSIIEVLSHVLSAPPKLLAEARPSFAFDPELQTIVSRCLEKSREARFESVADLAQALTAYLAKVRGTSPVTLPVETPAAHSPTEPAPAMGAPLPVAVPLVSDLDEEEIRIPGVRPRWPLALLFLTLLAGAGAYQAERSGMIHVRAWVGARAPGVHLHADPPALPLLGRDRAPVGIARGVFGRQLTQDSSGSSLRAEPERDSELPRAPGASAAFVETAPALDEPMSPEERTRREAAYRAYLERQGLVPLKEVLSDAAQPTLSVPPASEPAPPTQPPTQPPAPASDSSDSAPSPVAP